MDVDSTLVLKLSCVCDACVDRIHVAKYSLVVGFCAHGNEPSGFHRGREGFLTN
jgi:hypothetical protein